MDSQKLNEHHRRAFGVVLTPAINSNGIQDIKDLMIHPLSILLHIKLEEESLSSTTIKMLLCSWNIHISFWHEFFSQHKFVDTNHRHGTRHQTQIIIFCSSIDLLINFHVSVTVSPSEASRLAGLAVEREFSFGFAFKFVRLRLVTLQVNKSGRCDGQCIPMRTKTV